MTSDRSGRADLPIFARCAVLALLSLVAWSPPVYAQAAPQLDVWMMTFGPGEPVFLKFGHNALLIRIRDGATGQVQQERVYDYGLFNGASPTLVADFLQGRMQYWLGVTRLSSTMHRYRATNRDVAAQKLRLTPEQSRTLLEQLERNALPENRFYRYDYYYDNCSTRLRDVLDRITKGAVKKAFVGPATMSLRDHTLRHTASDWLYYLGLDVGLANVDEDIDLWSESFLPQKFREALRGVEVTIDGETVPFVEKEEVWFDGTRPDVPAQPPSRGPLLALIGFLIGGVFASWGWLGRRNRLLRTLYLIAAGLVGFGLAFFGVLLIYLWGFTDHSIAYGNENIFHLAPWAILAPVAALMSRRRGAPYLFRLFAAAAVLSLLGLLIKVVPGFGQDTYRLISLLLPIWVGLALGARSLQRRLA